MRKNESTPYADGGKRLRGARKVAGLSQADLAQKLSLSVRWVREIEKGRKRAGHDIQVAIFELLDTDVYGDLSDLAKNISTDMVSSVDSSIPEQAQPAVAADVPELSAPSIKSENFNFKPEAPVSPNNPFVLMCRECGQNEYVRREYCRCGSYLAGPVQDHVSDWETIALAELKKRVIWLNLFVCFGLPVVFLPLAIIMLSLTIFAGGPLESYVLHYLPEFAPGIPAMACVVLVAMMGLDRKRARLENMRKNLSFEHFLQSDYFKALRRPTP